MVMIANPNNYFAQNIEFSNIIERGAEYNLIDINNLLVEKIKGIDLYKLFDNNSLDLLFGNLTYDNFSNCLVFFEPPYLSNNYYSSKQIGVDLGTDIFPNGIKFNTFYRDFGTQLILKLNGVETIINMPVSDDYNGFKLSVNDRFAGETCTLSFSGSDYFLNIAYFYRLNDYIIFRLVINNDDIEEFDNFISFRVVFDLSGNFVTMFPDIDCVNKVKCWNFLGNKNFSSKYYLIHGNSGI